MRTFLLRLSSLALAAGLLACSPDPDLHAPAVAPLGDVLVPLPVAVMPGEGEWRLSPGAALRVSAPEGAGAALDWLDALGERLHGKVLATRRVEAQGADLVLVLDPALERLGAEGYVLEVSESGLSLRAAEPSGLFHGVTSLLQLLVPDGRGGLVAAAQRIEDSPRFGWRGLMLDSARHMQSVEEIKHLLDAMALHKLNVFHWHLTDDQGWRIEIRKYPRLAEVGGCRVPAGDAGVDPATGGVREYCGHYTQAQIREVVAYAAARYISVVPEIDMPGHAQAAVAAYPELGVTGEAPPVSNEWGVHTWLFNVEESTLSVLEDVLDEVVALFPGQFIHVGGDEAAKDQWKASAQVQARMRELGLADEEALQSWFIQRMERHLAGHGRRLIGWDEILEGGLAPNATVMSWRGTEGGLEAASMGHDVVMSPVSHLYLDYLQTDSANEPPGRPATIALEQVYGFEPIPDALAPERHHHVLGVQANVWTEHMRNYERVQHAVFPRIAALSEVAWSPAAHRHFPHLLDRLPRLLARYEAMDVRFATTPFEVDVQVAGSHRDEAVEISLSTRLGLGEIRYTLDGSEPGLDSPRYDGPKRLAPPFEVHARAFVDGQPLVPGTRRVVDDATLRRRADAGLAMCTGQLMLRLEDDGPAEGPRAVFNVDIFNPCWEWRGADLREVSALHVRAGRIPYYFQLWHDEAHRRFLPAQGPHGELRVQDGCDGPLLAEAAMPAEVDADGFVRIDLPLAADAPSADLCIRFTGDTRPTMWVLSDVTLVP